MGRIKTLLVKRKAKELFRGRPDAFSEEFSENKRLVEKFTDVSNKKMRNIIAGYITRLSRRKEVL